MESARNNFWLAGHMPNFKNTSSRLPFHSISFNLFKLIQTNDNRTHHSQSAGSFYRLQWNTVDMNSCRTQWCSYMKRNCDSCVNRWRIHQHLQSNGDSGRWCIKHFLYFFKAICNSWFYYLDALSVFLRAFYGGKKKKKLVDAYWKLSPAIDATYKQVEDSGFKSR